MGGGKGENVCLALLHTAMTRLDTAITRRLRWGLGLPCTDWCPFLLEEVVVRIAALEILGAGVLPLEPDDMAKLTTDKLLSIADKVAPRVDTWRLCSSWVDHALGLAAEVGPVNVPEFIQHREATMIAIDGLRFRDLSKICQEDFGFTLALGTSVPNGVARYKNEFEKKHRTQALALLVHQSDGNALTIVHDLVKKEIVPPVTDDLSGNAELVLVSSALPDDVAQADLQSQGLRLVFPELTCVVLLFQNTCFVLFKFQV